jgi:hypothetical protein
MPDPRPGRPREGFATANHLLPRGGRRYRLSTVGPTEVLRTAGGQRLATDRPPTGGIDTFHVVSSATMRAKRSERRARLATCPRTRARTRRGKVTPIAGSGRIGDGVGNVRLSRASCAHRLNPPCRASTGAGHTTGRVALPNPALTGQERPLTRAPPACGRRLRRRPRPNDSFTPIVRLRQNADSGARHLLWALGLT